MSNFLANATGIHISPSRSYFNRDQFGNALKNVAPAAGLIPGVGAGLGALLGGVGSALGRGVQHGANFGDILKQGASGAAIGAAGGQLTQGHGLAGLKSRFGGGFSPGSSPSTTQGAFNGYTSNGNGSWAATGSVGAPGTPAPGESLASKIGSGLSGVAGFAKDNPTAIGMGLQGIGNIAGAGAENRLKNAQAGSLEEQTQVAQAEQEAAKRRAAALAPFLQSLMGQMGQIGAGTFSKNPYT